VVVVPNGPDDSWKQALAAWQGNPAVRVFPLDVANQNVARNKGIEEANGELIRFLDDDDYLLPGEAASQYAAMQASGADVSSGPVLVRDEAGLDIGRIDLPETSDFLIAALSARRLQLPFAHVYRLSSLGDLRWPVEILRSEDIAFLIRYAGASPRRWIKAPGPVGVWFQHRLPRMSLDYPDSSVHETTAHELLQARDALDHSGRLDAAATRTIANALWQLVHRAFFLRPCYWSAVAKRAQAIDPSARPQTRLFDNATIRRMNPLALHWAALPVLTAKRAYRSCRAMLVGRDYRRTL
jgi:glycosyltransferase involved in cell wall biosynthesis